MNIQESGWKVFPSTREEEEFVDEEKIYSCG